MSHGRRSETSKRSHVKEVDLSGTNFLPGLPLAEQLLLQCVCGNSWVKHVPQLVDFLVGPQVKCPQCLGSNDAGTFISRVEDAALSAVVPPPIAGLIEGFIHPEVPVAAVAEEPTATEPNEPASVETPGADVDAADEVVNNG